MDPESPPLKSNTVKSVIMLVFRLDLFYFVFYFTPF